MFLLQSHAVKHNSHSASDMKFLSSFSLSGQAVSYFNSPSSNFPIHHQVFIYHFMSFHNINYKFMIDNIKLYNGTVQGLCQNSKNNSC